MIFDVVKANQMSLGGKVAKRQKELCDIFKLIMSACATGEDEIRVSHNISLEVRNELIKLGYDIRSTSGPTENDKSHTISWRDSVVERYNKGENNG